MKYYLSNRQAKELGNGKAIRIALPWPDAGIPGAHRHHDTTGHMDMQRIEAWYRESLDTHGLTYMIDWLRIVEVAVDPIHRPEGGLSAVFGGITTREVLLSVRIVCVVADIAIRHHSRSNYPTQWPGRLSVGNLSLP